MASSGASRHLSADYSPRHSWRGLFSSNIGFTPQIQSKNTIERCGATVRPSHKAEKNSTGPGTTLGISFLHSDGRRLRANQVAEEFGRGGFMPSKLAIAFLGMVVGGSAFTFAGLTTFLTVNQLQDRQIQTTQVQTSPPVVQARFAQLSQ
jgi:hypothetical protein